MLFQIDRKALQHSLIAKNRSKFNTDYIQVHQLINERISDFMIVGSSGVDYEIPKQFDFK
jgi:hypothetical protein